MAKSILDGLLPTDLKDKYRIGKNKVWIYHLKKKNHNVIENRFKSLLVLLNFVSGVNEEKCYFAHGKSIFNPTKLGSICDFQRNEKDLRGQEKRKTKERRGRERKEKIGAGRKNKKKGAGRKNEKKNRTKGKR